MTDQLSGLALDEACARAMGFQLDENGYWFDARMPNHRLHLKVATCLDIVLDYLLSIGNEVHVTVSDLLVTVHAVPRNRLEPSEIRCGVDIYEAVKLLVVAVAEARKA